MIPRTVDGCMRDGVPPPKKMLVTRGFAGSVSAAVCNSVR
jgi:hypothetical protein